MSEFVLSIDNCDQEPIHIPGLIQSHGALLAFSQAGLLQHRSSNAEQLLGHLPALGAALLPSHLDRFAEATRFIQDFLNEAADGHQLLLSYELKAADGAMFDLVLHVHQQLVIAEFETRASQNDNINTFSIKSQKAINAMRLQSSIQGVLETATREIRILTGFDRVMAYQFSHDDSGHVVAEAKQDTLDSLLNRRYPASDIPPQARRLYIVNTLRLIADVNAPSLAIQNVAGAAPLDLSHSVLRSVSPIHIEYLKNMGVSASMSISIVINGKLWGLIACHHMRALQIPYSIRMGCDVICQILASNILQLQTRDFAERQVYSAQQRADLALDIVNADNFVAALLSSHALIQDIITGDAILITYGNKHQEQGLDAPLATALVEWLGQHQQDFFSFASSSEGPEPLKPVLGEFSGAVGFCMDRINQGWLVVLRKEKVFTISWAGLPGKAYQHGPFGPRLTPRGSFEEWKETVKGQAEPWSQADLAIAHDLHMDLIRICNAKNAEHEQIRTQLMAILGHDLRDPLNTINMATHVMERQDGSSRMSERIRKSSGRMQRLINDVMDMSRLQNGMGLGLERQPTNLAVLLREIIEESLVGHPDKVIQLGVCDEGEVQVDPERINQVLHNLISNARHHGKLDTPIRVELRCLEHAAEVAIHNQGEPISDEVRAVLFNPFKRQSLDKQRNKSGMGLGLYIAHEIMLGHGGEIIYDYLHDTSEIRFRVVIPAT